MRSINTGKKRVKFPSTGDITVYLSLRAAMINELKQEFSKVAGKLQKSAIFIYMNNNQLEDRMNTRLLFIIATKKINYL